MKPRDQELWDAAMCSHALHATVILLETEVNVILEAFAGAEAFAAPYDRHPRTCVSFACDDLLGECQYHDVLFLSPLFRIVLFPILAVTVT